MAAIVYGGSPRHHSRITNAHHLHHPNALQQSQQSQHSQHSQSTVHHYNIPPAALLSTNATSPSQSGKINHLSYNQSSQHQTSGIIMPPASYLSTGSPMSSTTQQLTLPHAQYAHQPTVTLPPTPTSHYHHTASMYTTGRHNKRKSAVELLAESKPFYVKSEMVLDRHQQLNYRTMPGGGCGNGGNVASGIGMSNLGAAGPCSIMDRANLPNPICSSLSPSRIQQHHNHHHHHHHSRPTNRRSASTSSDLLQNKLRKLLNADTKDAPGSSSGAQVSDITSRYKSETHKYDSYNKYQTVKFNEELTVHPASNQNDMSMIYPSAFLSPQSLPPHPACETEIYSYGIDEPLVLTENYRAISPPAEYAAVDCSPDKDPNVRCGYQRSYLNSHDTTSDEPDYSSPSYNINSHKSLPDLHSQISRHSPHSEVLSSCSRGNRSNKSGGGSSLNRDSGGSSGHYTHRSEPSSKQREREANKICGGPDYRRDSGSSTQHSGNSYYMYGMSGQRFPDCPECRAKYQKDSECLLNFTTPEVPEAFQDEYPTEVKQTIRFYEETKIATARKVYHLPQTPTQHYMQPQIPIVRTPDNKEPDISPPPGTFKRQKCFRLKPRSRYSTSNDRNAVVRCVPEIDSDEDRKPILRSKSDISDRYYNRGMPLTEQPTSGKMAGGLEKSRKSESLSQLEKFFDRLGLNDEKFNEIYSIPKRRYSSDNGSDQSSTIFFSDVSTVDSTRLPDSTEIQAQMASSSQPQPYRPTEPPSIVERNARIIKWLCNCRKLQLT